MHANGGYAPGAVVRGSVEYPAVTGADRKTDVPEVGDYRMDASGIYRLIRTRRAPTWRRMTNFTAAITADLLVDDGRGQQHRIFQMRGAVAGQQPATFYMTPAVFERMGWPMGRLGVSAVIFPGGNRDHVRVAIQLLSGDVPKRRVDMATYHKMLLNTQISS